MAEKPDNQHTGGVGTLAKQLPTDRLKQEAQNLLTALGEKALSSVSSIGGDGSSGGGLGAVVKPLVKAGLGKAKDKVMDKAKEAIPGLGGGGGGGKDKKLKVTNIVEQIDVGAPVSLTYDLWTQFEDFPSYMKKVEDVQQESETEMEWKAQVFWSHRKWRSEILEQVPDKRIIWKSRAEKGHVNGAVTFHEIAPDLTRILLVLQYYPQGFFERTGNIWRAQGRRARLELKHFRRHLMTEVLLEPDEIEGWRGTVHEGEVVEEEEEPEGEEEEEDEEEEGEDEEEEAEEAEEEEEPEDVEDEDEEKEKPRRRSRR
ncbi:MULTISPECIES: SRPBCC family protein [Streptomyces]|uniref:SRPBCC family protein n=1 Tax=Streptomyces lonegramiae TaxID=3075524 RepID=A0ABU2XS54_9ACTN|nr:SRPBCC family protein [Streptomyces sp. DSM 41529]MDT0548749.1 SRPBCC family protein [Streptomyces sp. DSM 41529]